MDSTLGVISRLSNCADEFAHPAKRQKQHSIIKKSLVKLVILSEAKDLLNMTVILRFAQDDKLFIQDNKLRSGKQILL